ncbi:MAG: hypothetical protein JOZ22_14320 [Acidobacteriia bacterium]|nr:hypothetical protein [Terriglobia bacterium]
MRKRSRRFAAATLIAAVSTLSLAGVATARADDDDRDFRTRFFPFNLVVTRSVYVDTGSIIAGTTVLPPNCSPANCPTPVTAVTSSAYPYVFNNDTVDGNFGITSKIFLDQITPFGWLLSSLEAPNSSEHKVGPESNQIVTSFSSKSELAVNLSTDGKALTFMGYFAPIGAIDVSNSNTPGEIDPTVAPGNDYYRSVAEVDRHGRFHFTKTNAYTGDNGRAAILNDSDGANLVYMAGNAGNGTQTPQPVGVIISTGAQMLIPTKEPESRQDPGTPTAVGSFNIIQLGHKPDKIGKDTNFRGLTIFNNVLYYTKGSGGNGINTVYFVDTTGSVCTDTNGVGLPVDGATLPTSPLDYDTNPTVIQTEGLKPYNMCILKGFPTVLAKAKPPAVINYPFGIWFANATTVYVADEGSGATGTTDADFYTPATPAQNPTAGLQKWVFNSSAGEWQLAYTLTKGLDLGVPYHVRDYPTGDNSGPGGSNLPWAPATDGLRNITGIVDCDGNATIYATTSTISGSGDQGADPNKLVVITDKLSATTLPSSERFFTLRSAGFGEVLRGVSWTPGTVSR